MGLRTQALDWVAKKGKSIFSSPPKAIKKNSTNKKIIKKKKTFSEATPKEIKTMQKAFGYTPIKGAGKRANPGNAPAGTRAKKVDLSKQTTKVKKNKISNKKKGLISTVVLGSLPSVAGGGGDSKKKKTIPIPKRRPISQVDDFSKSKVKQGPPKGIAKKTPVKKKSKSNISGSSSYDADFTKKGLEKRGLSPKASMSKENLAKTTAAKDKKNAAGQDFGGKKKKKTAPMYESMGTMGGVKKMKMAKGYSAGGKIFTGR